MHFYEPFPRCADGFKRRACAHGLKGRACADGVKRRTCADDVKRRACAEGLRRHACTRQCADAAGSARKRITNASWTALCEVSLARKAKIPYHSPVVCCLLCPFPCTGYKFYRQRLRLENKLTDQITKSLRYRLSTVLLSSVSYK